MKPRGPYDLPAADPSAALMVSAREGDIEVLKENTNRLMRLDLVGDSIISHCISENTEDSFASLQYIATTPSFKKLLHLPNYMDGNYPLLFAVLKGSEKNLQFLLNNGARILTSDNHFGSPAPLLHAAVNKAHTGILHILLHDLATSHDKYDHQTRAYLLQFRATPIEHTEPITAEEYALQIGHTGHAMMLAQMREHFVTSWTLRTHGKEPALALQARALKKI